MPVATSDKNGLSLYGDFSVYVNISNDFEYKIHSVGGSLFLCDKNTYGFIAQLYHVFGSVKIAFQHLEYITTTKDNSGTLNVYKDGDYVCLQNKTGEALTNLYVKSSGRI